MKSPTENVLFDEIIQKLKAKEVVSTEEFKTLISDLCGKNQFTKLYKGNNILHYIVENGYIGILKTLSLYNNELLYSRSGIHYNIFYTKNEQGDTALHIATKKNNLKMIKKLILHSNSVVDIPDADGLIPVQYALKCEGKDKKEIVSFLFKEMSSTSKQFLGKNTIKIIEDIINPNENLIQDSINNNNVIDLTFDEAISNVKNITKLSTIQNQIFRIKLIINQTDVGGFIIKKYHKVGIKIIHDNPSGTQGLEAKMARNLVKKIMKLIPEVTYIDLSHKHESKTLVKEEQILHKSLIEVLDQHLSLIINYDTEQSHVEDLWNIVGKMHEIQPSGQSTIHNDEFC